MIAVVGILALCFFAGALAAWLITRARRPKSVLFMGGLGADGAALVDLINAEYEARG